MSERLEVAIEGQPTVDGRLLQAGALLFPETVVPVTGPGKGDLARVFGTASDFERDVNGRVSCLVTLEDDRLVPLSYTPAIDVRLVMSREEGETLVIQIARIIAVHLTTDMNNAWPELNRS